MNLKKIVLHQIQRNNNETPVLNLSDNELDHNDVTVTDFVSTIVQSFRSKSPTYGTFQQDKEIFPFQTFVQEYFDSISFIDFTQKSMRLLSKEMEVPKAKGGYVCFVHYEDRNQDVILTAMLDKSEQFTTDDATLDIKKLLTLDIEKLARANRLDTIKWINEEESYLSFIKGTREVSSYFRKFIGNTDLTSAKTNTVILNKAVNLFMRENEFTEDQKADTKQKLSNYFEKQFNLEEDIKLNAISAFLSQEQPTAFIEFVKNNDLEVSGDYRLNKKSDFSTFHRGKIYGKGYRLTFEKNLIRKNKIIRQGNDVLIKDVPEEILNREFEL